MVYRSHFIFSYRLHWTCGNSALLRQIASYRLQLRPSYLRQLPFDFEHLFDVTHCLKCIILIAEIGYELESGHFGEVEVLYTAFTHVTVRLVLRVQVEELREGKQVPAV